MICRSCTILSLGSRIKEERILALEMMKVRPEIRHGIVWSTLLALFFIPFLDSMACDDFARSSPAPGTGVEIRCNLFSGAAVPLASGMGLNDQEQKESSVHFFCPICLTLAEATAFYNVGISPSMSIFKHQPFRKALIQINFPIYKPP